MTDPRIIPAEELDGIRTYMYYAPNTAARAIERLLAHIAAQEAVIQEHKERDDELLRLQPSISHYLRGCHEQGLARRLETLCVAVRAALAPPAVPLDTSDQPD